MKNFKIFAGVFVACMLLDNSVRAMEEPHILPEFAHLPPEHAQALTKTANAIKTARGSQAIARAHTAHLNEIAKVSEKINSGEIQLSPDDLSKHNGMILRAQDAAITHRDALESSIEGQSKGIELGEHRPAYSEALLNSLADLNTAIEKTPQAVISAEQATSTMQSAIEKLQSGQEEPPAHATTGKAEEKELTSATEITADIKKRAQNLAETPEAQQKYLDTLHTLKEKFSEDALRALSAEELAQARRQVDYEYSVLRESFNYLGEKAATGVDTEQQQKTLTTLRNELELLLRIVYDRQDLVRLKSLNPEDLKSEIAKRSRKDNERSIKIISDEIKKLEVDPEKNKEDLDKLTQVLDTFKKRQEELRASAASAKAKEKSPTATKQPSVTLEHVINEINKLSQKLVTGPVSEHAVTSLSGSIGNFLSSMKSRLDISTKKIRDNMLAACSSIRDKIDKIIVKLPVNSPQKTNLLGSRFAVDFLQLQTAKKSLADPNLDTAQKIAAAVDYSTALENMSKNSDSIKIGLAQLNKDIEKEKKSLSQAQSLEEANAIKRTIAALESQRETVQNVQKTLRQQKKGMEGLLREANQKLVDAETQQTSARNERAKSQTEFVTKLAAKANLTFDQKTELKTQLAEQAKLTPDQQAEFVTKLAKQYSLTQDDQDDLTAKLAEQAKLTEKAKSLGLQITELRAAMAQGYKSHSPSPKSKN